jgi:hypothetical protein
MNEGFYETLIYLDCFAFFLKLFKLKSECEGRALVVMREKRDISCVFLSNFPADC